MNDKLDKVTSYSVAKQTGLLSVGEVDFLKSLAKQICAYGIVVIIGAGSGTSSLALLEVRPDLTIYSIDSVFPTKDRYTPGEKANLISAGYWETGSVIQVLGESQIIGKKWSIPYDFIFIDGDHRYPAIKEDIILWIPKAKKDAILVFHDYGDKTIKPKAGVKQAVDELLLDKCVRLGYERFTLALRKK